MSDKKEAESSVGKRKKVDDDDVAGEMVQRLEPRNYDATDWHKDPEDMSQWCTTCDSWEWDCKRKGRCYVDPARTKSEEERLKEKAEAKWKRRIMNEKLGARWADVTRQDIVFEGRVYKKTPLEEEPDPRIGSPRSTFWRDGKRVTLYK